MSWLVVFLACGEPASAPASPPPPVVAPPPTADVPGRVFEDAIDPGALQGIPGTAGPPPDPGAVQSDWPTGAPPPGPAPRGNVTVDTLDTSGLDAADQDGFHAVLAKYNGQVRSCYELRLKQNPSLVGRVEFEVTFAGGLVTRAEPYANTTGDGELASCVTARMAGWKGAPSLAGTIIVPYLFRQPP
jgi:hypothetical protein